MGTGSAMTIDTADMANKTGQTTRQSGTSGETADPTRLDHRYRQIGISAVAAAARYQGGAKNPAYAPAAAKWRDTSEEVAA